MTISTLAGLQVNQKKINGTNGAKNSANGANGANGTNGSNGANGTENSAASLIGNSRRETARNLRENHAEMLREATERIAEQQRAAQRRQRPPRRAGSVRLSNTDSLRRAHQVRSRLNAKLMEVYGSDMEERARGAAAMDIKLQINRVDRQITAIRRRERAMQEEQTTRRSEDTPDIRRRRARDMQERRIYVRADYLYHADQGGFDPNDMMEVVL